MDWYSVGYEPEPPKLHQKFYADQSRIKRCSSATLTNSAFDGSYIYSMHNLHLHNCKSMDL
jgi:hypothetical protein